MEHQTVKIRYNKDKKWFEAFMPDGTQIPNEIGITIKSYVGELMTATIEVVVSVDDAELVKTSINKPYPLY